MVQKLLILQRDTKEELQIAIENNILNKNMRLINFSVLERQRDSDDHLDHRKIQCFEAWCIVEVPENVNKFHGQVLAMGMTE